MADGCNGYLTGYSFKKKDAVWVEYITEAGNVNSVQLTKEVF
ncbi:MAG: hypothetical protein AAF149_23995 [Bacteroidota bacterium]